MASVVILLRAVSLLAFAGPMLLFARGRRDGSSRRAGGEGRAAVAANLAASGLFFAALVILADDAAAPTAPPLALTGCLISLAGAALVLRARAALGAAWSLAPRADQAAGLVTSGPYRIVRHPIYLGFVLLAVGQALAFGSWAALAIALFGLVPTFAWRARIEERLLSDTFGERYAAYRQRTRMIIPHLL